MAKRSGNEMTPEEAKKAEKGEPSEAREHAH